MLKEITKLFQNFNSEFSNDFGCVLVYARFENVH